MIASLLLASGETLGQCVAPAPDRPEEGMPTISDVQDKLAIRELIENWAVWRDSFQWDRFRTVWHPEGRMWATWFQGTYEEFIAANLDGYAQGRAHLSLPRRLLDRHQGQARHRPDQDVDLAARHGRRRGVRRDLHRPVLRFPGKAQGQVGPGAGAA